MKKIRNTTNEIDLISTLIVILFRDNPPSDEVLFKRLIEQLFQNQTIRFVNTRMQISQKGDKVTKNEQQNGHLTGSEAQI